MKTRIGLGILLTLFFVLLSPGVARADPVTINIRDDSTGGDCTKVGTWDQTSKTCTLTMDLTEGIQISNSGITLDGNGHSITGNDSVGSSGVFTAAVSGITIKNLTVTHFGFGISTAETVGGSTIAHNTLSNNIVGIHAFLSLGNAVSYNTISNNGTGVDYLDVHGGSFDHNILWDNTGDGIHLQENTSFVTFTDNSISNNHVGIHVNGYGHTLTNNTISNNAGLGLFVDGSCVTFSGNHTIYNNDFIDNALPQAQVVVGGCRVVNVVFNLQAITGGNYWSNYHTPAQGCNDLNQDGFCDAPYVFPGAQDNLPWTRPNGWIVLDANKLISAKDRACASGSISKQGICNSLGAKLNAVKASIERGDFDTAQNQLTAFLNELKAQNGKAMNQQAYDLLKAAAQNLIAKLSQ